MAKVSFWDKVEIRAIIVIILAIVITGTSICYTVYNLTYRAMLEEIRERAEVAYNHSKDLIDLKSFSELEDKSDEVNEIYIKAQQQLNQVRKIANIRYLYTTKKNAEGQHIYLIDGLDLDAEDFRHTGDLIEEEIIPKLELAYQGQNVYADDIIVTQWGEIFVTYWPVYNESGAIVGAVGMEFDAKLIFNTWENTKKYTVIISSAIMFIYIVASYFLFKKISDPFLKKLAYTDYLTGLKNRTAFELDLKRYDLDKATREKIAILIFDINDLKIINDTHGHLTGDIYIKKAANAINFSLLDMCDSYRIGGDEFASLIIGADENAINQKIKKIIERLGREKVKNISNCGISYGLAFYDKTKDNFLKDTFQRADDNMYNSKKVQKNNGEV